MPQFQLNNPVILFKHKEYGARLLFKNGVTNRRDELGKNGVVTHSRFASLFYRTITINALVTSKKNKQKNQIFYINRNSLIKYLDMKGHIIDRNEVLIDILKSTLWQDDNNSSANQQQRAQQVYAGSRGLRHAGRHNQSLVNGFFVRFTDYFKASFLGWLYQKTIGGLNRIKVRFLFVATEKNILEAGEVLAKERFHDTYRTVPAYKAHISQYNEQNITNSALRFSDISVTNKENYIKKQQHDNDTHLYGKYPRRNKTDTSTGTTGKPAEWVRSQQEIATVKKSLQLAAKIQFGERQLSYINAFALGPWATGLTTYELMRETGSVFATGPDKEKIINKLVSIFDYEKHQLELALNKFQRHTSGISNDDKVLIGRIVNETLKALLKDSNLSLKKELFKQFLNAGKRAKQLIIRHNATLFSLAECLNREKQQIILAGYPPFLKDLADYALKKKHVFSKFSVVGVVGGQAISEAMRDQLVNHGFNQIYSSYGASDLDINLGVEGDDEISIRKTIEQNPGLARELYGDNKGLPMVFHYDPMNCHVEVDNQDKLIFTVTRTDRSSPRIRYDLGDKGRVYTSSDVQALLAKYGQFRTLKTNLPLMFVWGRDSTVVFNGANVAFTELERAITDNVNLEPIVLKKAFYTHVDKNGREKLEIWLELNDDKEIPDEIHAAEYATQLLIKLSELNQDFHYQLSSLDEGADLPTVCFFKRNESPISEADGHRKQVLIFQKEVNLDANYRYPGEGKSYRVMTSMSDEILRSVKPTSNTL